MSSADDIRRWSDELARDPSSLVFLELGDALRREGQLDLAMKIAGRGLARHSMNVAANDLVLRIAADRATRDGAPSPAATPAEIPPPDAPQAETPHEVGLTAAPEDDAQAILVDGQGLIIAGSFLNATGRDIAEQIAAQLSGISGEAARTTRLLDLGEWRTVLIETQTGAVGLAPAEEGGLVVVAASRSMPLGMLRRLLARCLAQASILLGAAT